MKNSSLKSRHFGEEFLYLAEILIYRQSGLYNQNWVAMPDLFRLLDVV